MSEGSGVANTGIYGTMLKKSTVDELKTDWRQRETYITRGAFMYCTMGTHEDVLNQPKVNGMFVNKNPIMTVSDCKVSTSIAQVASYLGVDGFEQPGTVIDGNIHSFGFCRADQHPSKVYETTLKPKDMHREFAFDFDPDQPPSAANPDKSKKIYPCVPKFISSSANPLKGSALAQSLMGGERAEAAKNAIMEYFGGPRWQKGSETLFINGVPALTSKSCLTCAYGGDIGFLTNGMDMPPFEFVEHNLKQE
ncbi:DUF4280 domain-containing protein [Paenibacillus oralis]|uniref:DUF4280 domain-containing protein n=1 Tax=Paenibacillus oralis TaxID=2490856 RepID=A0A3P3TUS7_9BACL|nr:PAAR-like protein [Paenibacillus oralis]RRJ61885.1 DUF4280 domain-containing protein [Paenibacillus oralis]